MSEQHGYRFKASRPIYYDGVLVFHIIREFIIDEYSRERAEQTASRTLRNGRGITPAQTDVGIVITSGQELIDEVEDLGRKVKRVIIEYDKEGDIFSYAPWQTQD